MLVLKHIGRRYDTIMFLLCPHTGRHCLYHVRTAINKHTHIIHSPTSESNEDALPSSILYSTRSHTPSSPSFSVSGLLHTSIAIMQHSIKCVGMYDSGSILVSVSATLWATSRPMGVPPWLTARVSMWTVDPNVC